MRVGGSGCATGRDRGSATVWMLLATLSLWAGTVTAVAMGAAVIARHRAESAADLAALAGARALVRGDPDPCRAAVVVATSGGSRVLACRPLTDGSLAVVVESALPRLLTRWPGVPPARARARAGGSWSVVGDR